MSPQCKIPTSNASTKSSRRISIVPTPVDRAAFLKQTAIPLTIRNLEAQDVKIRLMGDFAIIHARTRYTTADGDLGSGCYTDVWARQNGRWLAVSAHVSR